MAFVSRSVASYGVVNVGSLIELKSGSKLGGEAIVISSLGLAYFGAGKLGLELAFVHPSATAVWAPTGIAVASFLVIGYRVWPAVFLGAFLVNLTNLGSVATSLGIAAGNTLEGVAAAYLVNRYAGGKRAFERWQHVLLFVALAGVLSPVVSATFGVSSLALGGYAEWATFRDVWLTWWLGDAAGAIIVGPLLVIWGQGIKRWKFHRGAEALASMVLLASLAQVVFGGWFPGDVKTYALSYLCLPVLVWIALRYGRRETAAANVLLSLLAIWGTLEGYGPFARDGAPHESLLLLQGFMAACAIFDLTLVAVVFQRRRADDKRERLLVELQRAFERLQTLELGLLPICASCKKIRDEKGEWEQLETYAEARWDVRFTHGMCPDCLGELFP